MPTKKKKPTLKPAANRGFATTSVPKKVEEPAEEAPVEDDASAAPDQNGASGSASADGSGAATPAVKGRYGFDEEDAEQQELPHSVFLEFANTAAADLRGTTVQAACEDVMTHRAVVHLLKSYHKAWTTQA